MKSVDEIFKRKVLRSTFMLPFDANVIIAVFD